ncbi:MAG TPA: fasciclin domain-containing protein [Chitinophagaceae bacterium]|nr:fasciclin domain-containing protein [Chitinophagaceae bacterium]
MRSKMLLWALVFVSFPSIHCSNNNNSKNKISVAKANSSAPPTSQMNSSRTIAQNISSDSSHSILAEAFQSTGLMETLSQAGPFTVFAPYNEAFRKLPPGTYESLMQKRKKDLANILSYHIIAGAIKTKEMKDGEKLRTLTGEELIITLRNNKVFVNGVHVINPDIEASNGIIYVADGILFPRNQSAAGHQP